MENAQNPNEMPQGNAPIQDGSGMGSSAPAPTPAPEPTSAPVAAPTTAAPAGSPHADERRGMAAISYLGVLCLIPLIFAKDSAFAQYHAKQGLVLAIIGVILKIVSDLLWQVPFGGALAAVLGLALFIVSVMGLVKAFRGEKFEIPMVSEWAAKISF